jgi:hypothetical protein
MSVHPSTCTCRLRILKYTCNIDNSHDHSSNHNLEALTKDSLIEVGLHYAKDLLVTTHKISAYWPFISCT